MTRYYDDLEVGMEWFSAGRTITETDLVLFAAVTGDYHPMHTDQEYAKKSPFGTRIAHGLLGLCYAMGGMQHVDTLGDSAIAFFGIDKWEFRGPVFIGDTIKAKLTVADKRETKKPDRGLITMRMAVVNQRGEEVQVGQYTVMVTRKIAG